MKKNSQKIEGNNNIQIGGDIIIDNVNSNCDNLTDRQIKNRWSDIKREIKNRPLLAYRVGIPLDQWNEYIHSIPNREEVNRIYDEIKEDRKQKTKRIREKLGEVIGYREANIYAQKMGISSTTIKNIIENKSPSPSYDMINRIEIFLNAIDETFEVSLENSISFKEYVQNLINQEMKSINNIANYLNNESYKLLDLLNGAEKDIFGKPIHPTSYLSRCINNLHSSKEKLDVIFETYIKKN